MVASTGVGVTLPRRRVTGSILWDGETVFPQALNPYTNLVKSRRQSETSLAESRSCKSLDEQLWLSRYSNLIIESSNLTKTTNAPSICKRFIDRTEALPQSSYRLRRELPRSKDSSTILTTMPLNKDNSQRWPRVQQERYGKEPQDGKPRSPFEDPRRRLRVDVVQVVAAGTSRHQLLRFSS